MSFPFNIPLLLFAWPMVGSENSTLWLSGSGFGEARQLRVISCKGTLHRSSSMFPSVLVEHQLLGGADCLDKCTPKQITLGASGTLVC